MTEDARKRTERSALTAGEDKSQRGRGRWQRRLRVLALFFVLLFFVVACQKKEMGEFSSDADTDLPPAFPGMDQVVLEGGPVEEKEGYYLLEDLALYVQQFGKLPPNYIKKKEAQATGWKTSDAPGAIVGGDRFGNREGLLPKDKGRTYFEADIIAGYSKNRGPERLIYSSDGLLFYTKDHYDHFVQVIPKERSPR